MWKVLDSKFGNIDVTQQSLRKRIENMELYPKTEETEQSNIEGILDFIDLSRRHNRRTGMSFRARSSPPRSHRTTEDSDDD